MNTSQDTDRTVYRETPVRHEPRQNNSWLPLLLLLPLLFIGGYLLGNSMDNTANDQVTASANPRFGVGGGPGTTPVVTPLPDEDPMITDEDRLQTPMVEEEFEEDDDDRQTMSPSPSASVSASPAAILQRTGEESSI